MDNQTHLHMMTHNNHCTVHIEQHSVVTAEWNMLTDQIVLEAAEKDAVFELLPEEAAEDVVHEEVAEEAAVSEEAVEEDVVLEVVDEEAAEHEKEVVEVEKEWR